MPRTLQSAGGRKMARIRLRVMMGIAASAAVALASCAADSKVASEQLRVESDDEPPLCGHAPRVGTKSGAKPLKQASIQWLLSETLWAGRIVTYVAIAGEEAKRRRPGLAHCARRLQLGAVTRRVEGDVAEMHGEIGRRSAGVFPYSTPVCNARGSRRRQMAVSYDHDAHGYCPAGSSWLTSAENRAAALTTMDEHRRASEPVSHCTTGATALRITLFAFHRIDILEARLGTIAMCL
jgi:hypothetical protein